MSIFHSASTRRARLGAALLATTLPLMLPPLAQAETYHLVHPDDSVIGDPFYFKARSEDTLLDIARQNNLGFQDMKMANPGVDVWVPGAGTEVMVPTFYVLPNAPHEGIIINRAEKRLYFFPPDNPNVVNTYAISVGRDGLNTPLGTFSIIEKKKDPVWVPGPNVRAAHAKDGDILPAVVPAGPDNPLGQFAMRLSNPDYLIHGTSKPWGLGMEVSAGCIRMYPEGIEDLFKRTALRTRVTIVDQPYKLGWRGNDLYMEVQIDKPEKTRNAHEVIPAEVANAEGVVIDWDAAQRAIKGNAGVPIMIGRRQISNQGTYLPMIF